MSGLKPKTNSGCQHRLTRGKQAGYLCGKPIRSGHYCRLHISDHYNECDVYTKTQIINNQEKFFSQGMAEIDVIPDIMMKRKGI